MPCHNFSNLLILINKSFQVIRTSIGKQWTRTATRQLKERQSKKSAFTHHHEGPHLKACATELN